MRYLTLILLLIPSVLLGCAEFFQPEYSDDEIADHAKEKASAIVYDYYKSFQLFSLSTEVLDSFFESKSIVAVQVKASYEWHTKEWDPTAGGYNRFVGWVGGFVDRQFKGDRTHLVKFKVMRDVEQIEKSISYQNANPPFQPPTAFRN